MTLQTAFGSMRVLQQLQMDGLVNGKDLRLAVSLDEDIHLSGPLSFRAISVNNLITRDKISSIDFDHWIENSLRSTSATPQVITANWRIGDLFADAITSTRGVNGFDAGSFASQLSNANRQLYQHYQETCNRVKSFAKDSQNNILYLSHFEFAFKLHHSQRINSVYSFAFAQLNYLAVNFGCVTTLYFWNRNADRYDRLTDIYTGRTDEWIHVIDLRGILNLVSLGYEPTERSGCEISGANIWQHNQNKQSIDLITKFAKAGDLRSLQIKLASRTHFYALRTADYHVIEYNLNGAAVSELNANVGMSRQAMRFVPNDANMGLALTNGEMLAFIDGENGQRWRREIPCDIIAKAVSNLKRAFNDYDTAKSEALGSFCANCTDNGDSFEQLREKIDAFDSSVVPLAMKLLSFLDDGGNETIECTGPALNVTDADPQVGSIFDRFQDVIVDEIDTITYLLTGNRRRENRYPADDGVLHQLSNLRRHELLPLDLLGSARQNFSAIRNGTGDAEVGGMFGILLDALTPAADILIEKVVKYYHKRKGDVGSTARNAADEDVGDELGKLVENLTPIADTLTDKIVDFIRKNEQSTELSDESDDDPIIGAIFGNVQDKIRVEMRKRKEQQAIRSDDETVGAAMDVSEDKVLAVSDKIVDELMLRLESSRAAAIERHGELLISVHAKNGTKLRGFRTNRAQLASEMEKLRAEFGNEEDVSESNRPENDNLQFSFKSFFGGVGGALVEVYDFGKHVYYTAKAMEESYDEDQRNDNINYGRKQLSESDNKHSTSPMHEKPDDRTKDRNGAQGDDNGSNLSATAPTTSPPPNVMQTMPNPYFPSQTNDEVVAVRVGPNRKTLVIVSSTRENVIKGDHDTIQVSFDRRKTIWNI